MIHESPARLTALDPAEFRAAMRRPACAVAVLATRLGDSRAGLTATAVCSLSDDPPSVLACIHQRSSALAAILKSGMFSVNDLSDAQADIAQIFAGRGGLAGDDRFDGSAWTTLATGAPVLRDALSSFDCRLASHFDHATHTILIGKVAAIATPQARRGLVYADGGFGQPTPLDGAA